MEGGSTGKYLLYAIGEIALVVIGILIALQINNLNEWRKDRVLEKNALYQLVENLNLNISRLQYQLERIDISNASSGIINTAINNNFEYRDTLDRHFLLAIQNVANFKMSQAGYESLKDSGLGIIRDNFLKNEIVYLFEHTYLLLDGRLIWGNSDNPEWNSYITEHFMSYRGGRKPFEYDFIINDNYFKGLLSKAYSQRNFFNRFYTESFDESQRVLQLIKDELSEHEIQ